MCNTYREANRAADCLADLGHFLDLGVWFYMSLPPSLEVTPCDDAVGVAIPWMIH